MVSHQENRPIDLAFKYAVDFTHNEDVNACRLSGEELTLVGRTLAGDEVPLDKWGLAFAHEVIADCPTNNDQESFRWVADMADLGAGKVRGKALTTLGSLVGMRLKLTQGTLKTGGFRAVDVGLVRWSFDGGKTSAALAEEVTWEYRFAEANVEEVVLKSSAAHSLVLRPYDGTVEVWILNMPLGQVLRFEPAKPFDANHHFAEFFRLADGNPNPVIPIPDTTRFCGPPLAASNPKCPPALFAPLGT